MLPDRVPELHPAWLNPKTTASESSLAVSPPSLHQLLTESFDSLKTELSERGNTPEFLRLRQFHGERLRAWWGSKRLAYSEAQKTGEATNSGFEPWIKISEDETVHVSSAENAMTDEPILTIGQRTSREENEVTLTANDDRVDIFMSPPKITCKYKGDPGKLPDYNWEVVFRGSAITTFTRIIIHEDPDNVIPYVKQAETLDASIFGIDRVGMLEELGLTNT